MCGIFVVYHKNGFKKNKYIIDIYIKNAKLMNHRGNVDKYLLIDNNILFYHNRLAINDLTSNGNQPIINNLIYIVVNGEIYNYYELYNEVKLNLPSYNFISNSDSEIIPSSLSFLSLAICSKGSGLFALTELLLMATFLIIWRISFNLTI
jgi:asparagine synthase (glutamine-hydrolysing)